MFAINVFQVQVKPGGWFILRGVIKIENRENLGQCPNRGGGGQKQTEMSQFQVGNF